VLGVAGVLSISAASQAAAPSAAKSKILAGQRRSIKSARPELTTNPDHNRSRREPTLADSPWLHSQVSDSVRQSVRILQARDHVETKKPTALPNLAIGAYQGGTAMSCRWPGVSAPLSLRRPSRHTPGHAARTARSAQPICHADWIRASHRAFHRRSQVTATRRHASAPYAVDYTGGSIPRTRTGGCSLAPSRPTRAAHAARSKGSPCTLAMHHAVDDASSEAVHNA
jgi:hypothetical protein